ncbi:MAG: amidohydrolase family protein [Oscillochloris sp.]|nr:amidohydrolase family protein [Oscillochloris sp.]
MKRTYTAARLYTALSEEVIAPGAVTIDAEQIVYAGALADAPADVELVDLGDVTLLPGLIDSHVHLTLSASEHVLEDYSNDSDQIKLIRGVEACRRALLAGVTTVRECGGQNELIFALRAAAAGGIIPAPRIIAAGGAITTTGGHCWFFGLEADSEADLRRMVRAQVKAGADFIKVMASGGALTPRTNPAAAQYTPAQIQAICDEAKRLGLDVAAHCHATESVICAAQAGVRTIEHCSFLTPEGIVYDQEAARAVHASGAYVCPTLAIAKRAAASLAEDHPLQQMRRRMGGTRMANLRRLHALGVPFISGSDAGVTLNPFEDFAYNLTELVDQVGLTPHQALQTATRLASEALRRPDIGTLANGRSADLIAVHGNPLEQINSLFEVRAVIARGVRYQ